MRSAFELEGDLALRLLVLRFKKHVAVEEALHLVECARTLRFERNLAERRQVARQIPLNHHLAVRQPHRQAAHVILPVRQARIGDGADHDPLIFERQGKRFLDERPGPLRVRAQNPGEEAHVEARCLRLLQRAVLAQAADHGRNRHRVWLRAVCLDPALRRIGPGSVDGRRRGRRGLQERDNNDGGQDAAHGLLSLTEMPGGRLPDAYRSRSF